MRGVLGLGRLGRRSRTTAFYVVLVSVLVLLAVTARGEPRRRVDLHDGGVWVTSDADHAFGRFNKQIGQLDAVVFPAQAGAVALDVLQDGSTVVAWDRGAGTLTAIDPAQRAPSGEPVDLPPGGSAGIGGGSLATLAANGDLRATRTGGDVPDVSALAAGTPPLARVPGAKPVLAVGTDGTVHVAAPGAVVSVRPHAESFAAAQRTDVPALRAPQVTAVGGVAVALDTETGTIVFPATGKSVPLPGGAEGAVLQQPGPTADEVVVAGPKVLWLVPLDAGEPRQISDAGTGDAASPVRNGACVHSAWGGGATAYVKWCDGQASPAQRFASSASGQPVFRVNRGHVVLNETVDGAVYTVDDTVREQKRLWERITPRPVNQPPDPNVVRERLPHAGEDRPPAPVDDRYGARPGRATVLHVLDNDTDPEGDVLMVSAVSPPDVPGATAAIAPDGQSVVVTLPQGVKGELRLKYTVDDGYGKSASATVVVEPRGSDQNAKPAPRSGYEAPKLSVAPGGTLRLPVLADWRDFDGDPVFVQPRGDDGRTAVTSDGLLLYTAPSEPGRAEVAFSVTDGLSAPAGAALAVTVLHPERAPSSVAPLARPDAIRVTVGRPVAVPVLANDLPGADAVDPAATLKVARDVRPTAGIEVTTDTTRGLVTVRAARPGAYQLEYAAASGSAPMAIGLLRVDAYAAPAEGSPPVAMPDAAVVRGSRAVVVDVLANDIDPGGGILVVEGAEGDEVAGLSVSVVDGRLLRVTGEATAAPTGRPTSGNVTYRIANGTSPAVTGSVAVTRLLDDGSNAPPFAVDDAVVVRAGDSTSVRVLDNDFDPDGDPLRLTDVPIDVPLRDASAAVSGRNVRVATPATVTQRTEFTVEYVVEDAGGARATGRVVVSVVPVAPPEDDEPPTPENIEGRLVAGDTYVVHVPVYGVDPDGDSVTVTAVPRAPLLGRIVATGADFVTYQAYPTSAGTDTFTYEVVDAYGQSGHATVRLGVMPPGAHTAPVAVDDEVSAQPGRTVQVDVVRNDVMPRGARATVLPLDHGGARPPEGATLDGNVVGVRVPAAGAQPVVVAYAVTDGSGEPSTAHVTVYGVSDATLAPSARDDVPTAGPTPDGGFVVDVVANDSDADGPVSALTVRRVFHPDVRIDGPRLLVPAGPHPRQVAYEITDRDGRTSVAALRLPGQDATRPRLVPGARIRVDVGGTVVVGLRDLVEVPSGRDVRITTTDHLAASPAAGVAVTARDATSITVRGLGSYAGPGAVSFQVTDGANLQDERAQRVTLTVPVQVGPEAPALRCPAAPMEVVAGGADVRANLVALCHVWVDTTLPEAPEVELDGSWATTPAGVGFDIDDANLLVLTAGNDAKPGAKGTLTLTVPGTPARSALNIAVVAAGRPKVRPVTLPALRAGQATTVDFSGYVTSSLRRPQVLLASTLQVSGRPAATRIDGTRLTVTPGRDSSGPVTFDVVVADLPGRPDRQVHVVVTGTVQGRPGRPAQPTLVSEGNGSVVLTWRPPADNGASIRHYEVGGAPRAARCVAAPCTVSGLRNGTTYRLTLTAVNIVGKSDPSAPVSARPDQVPPAVGQVKVEPGDRAVNATWTAPRFDGSPITGYQVQIQPAPASGTALRTATSTSARFTGLTNGVTYRVRVRAKNGALANGGYGAWSVAAAGVPFGTPPVMRAPEARGAAVPDPAATRAVTVSWPAADGNGRNVTKYTVTQYVDSSAEGSFGTTVGQVSGTPASFAASGGYATSFTVANDGRHYRFAVQATNAAGLTSPLSPKSNAVQAAAPPSRIANVTAKDHPDGSTAGYNGAIHVFFTVPEANAGSVTSVEYEVNGSRGSWPSPGSAGTAVERSIAVSNGTTVTVVVRACNDAGLCGPWSDPSNQVTPYGPPAPPNVFAIENGTEVSYSWSAGGGNGRPVQYYRVCIDSSPCFNTRPNTVYKDYGYASPWRISVQVFDTEGQASSATVKSGTTQPAPMTLVVSKGRAGTVTGCTSASCAWVRVTATNFAPNTRYTIGYYCDYPATGCSPWITGTFTTNGAGSATFENHAVYGHSGKHVWVRVGTVESNHLTW